VGKHGLLFGRFTCCVATESHQISFCFQSLPVVLCVGFLIYGGNFVHVFALDGVSAARRFSAVFTGNPVPTKAGSLVKECLAGTPQDYHPSILCE
jgi:hypothetical protein